MRKQKINFPSVKEIPREIVKIGERIVKIPDAEKYVKTFDIMNCLKRGGTVINGKRV